jgi:hypothetical protein
MQQRDLKGKGDPSIRLNPEIAGGEGLPFYSLVVIVHSILAQGKRVAGPTCRDMGEPALVL